MTTTISPNAPPWSRLVDALQAEIRRKDADIEELRAENERLREDCADLYQIVAAAMLDDDPVEYTEADVVRVLDNLSAAASGEPRPHKLQPWPNAKQPPCLQCGAMTPDEATTKCLGQAAGDGCHGCDIWPE